MLNYLHSEFECLPSEEEGGGFFWNLSIVSITVNEGHLHAERVIVATSG